MTTITLNDQEKSVLLQLIDLAVKAGGLQVAEAALVLSRKINTPEPVIPPEGPVADVSKP